MRTPGSCQPEWRRQPGSPDNFRDEINLNAHKPTQAVYATIDLLYQGGTSREYIQFLWNDNNGSNVFLGGEGVNMLDAWINADAPVAMQIGCDRKQATALIGTAPGVLANDSDTDGDTLIAVHVPDKDLLDHPATSRAHGVRGTVSPRTLSPDP
jgi:hypothetical protein